MRRQGRRLGEPRIVAVLARQQRERDAALARQRREPLAAVAPPVETAEQAHQDHLGMRADAIDPEIDRHRMAQVAQMREPHARQRVALDRPRRREPRKIAVGERQYRPRRPASGRDRPARRSRRGSWSWSRAGASLTRASVRVTAARSSPFNPITTSRPCARLGRIPRPVVLVRHPRADRLHQQPHRLAGNRDEALHAEHVVAFGDRGDAGRRARRDRRSRAAARRSCRNRRGRAPARRRGGCGGSRCRPRCRCRGRAGRRDRPCRRPP